MLAVDQQTGHSGLHHRLGPVIGIESSCDETACAVLDPHGSILAEAVLSQQADHAPFGGVVPEIAARAHLQHLPALAQQVMAEAGVGFADLAGVAATCGPGLIGGLIVGAGFGKGVALAHGLPFVAVNHLEAHALTARLPGLVPGGAPFPYLLLLLSGGHCQCVAVEGVGRYRKLGGTIDDAVGEAFDKVGKLLGLPWPGGPALERLAATRRGSPSRGRCWAGRDATSASPASRPRWRSGSASCGPLVAARCRTGTRRTWQQGSSVPWRTCWRTGRHMRWR